MIFPGIAAISMPISAIALLSLRALVLGRMGGRETEFPRRAKRQFVGVLVAGPLLVAIDCLRAFDPVVSLALSATGLFGFVVALADILCVGIGGIYENGIVWNSVAVFYRRVESFARLDPLSVEIATRGRSRRIVSFADPDLADRLVARLETSAKPLP